MKPIDRVYATLYHEEPDKVPDPNDLVGSGGSVIPRVTVKSGSDFRIRRTPFGSIHLDYINPSRGTGFFKSSWNPQDLNWTFTIAPAVRWPEDLDRTGKPTLDYADLEKAKKRAKELHEKGYFVLLSHHTAFDTAWRFLRGLKQWLIDIVRDPAFARRVVEFGIKPQIEIANAYIEEAHIDGVHVNGDLGTPEGSFISTMTYREMIYPWDRKMAESYHKRGAFLLIHSHGYIMPILGDMVRAGFDSINPVSPLCRMNLAEVKERCGDKITLYTDLAVEMPSKEKVNTSEYSNMLHGSDIKKKVEALAYTVGTAASGGGFMFRQIARGQTEEQLLYMKA